MPFRTQLARHTFSTLLSVVAAVLCFVIALQLILASTRHELQRNGQDTLATFDAIFGEIQSVTDALNRLGYADCNRDNLLAMRRAVFNANYIKGIGFFQDGQLVCATSSGKLRTPLTEPKPDYQDAQGNQFWLRSRIMLFRDDSTPRYAFIAQRGRYNVVLELQQKLAVEMRNARDWELLFQGQGHPPVHMAGVQGLFDGSLDQEQLTNTRFSACSSQYPQYCLALRQSSRAVLEQNSYLMVVAFIFSLIVGAATSIGQSLYRDYRSSIRVRLRQGLRHQGFYWLLQPVVDMASGKVIGAEALARFADDIGPLSPDQFIDRLRELELAWPFTVQMLNRTLAELEACSKLPAGFKVSFNIYPHLLATSAIRELMALPAIKASRFKLVFEVTEDEELDKAQAQANLHYLRQQGIGLAVDDFGTGYANLGQLIKMDCDLLKIDRSFITDMEEHSVRSSLIPQIVGIARQLNVQLVAEGVENERQYQALRKLGVDYAQGWLFGKPMTLGELVVLLEQQAAAA